MDQEYNYLERYTNEILFDHEFSFNDNSVFYHTSFGEFCTSNVNVSRLYNMLKVYLDSAGSPERIEMLRYATTVPRKIFESLELPDLFSRFPEIDGPER